MKRTKNTKQKSSPRPTDCPSDQPASEMISVLAYSIWEQEGHPDGRDVEHWLQAEAQLRWRRLPEAAPGSPSQSPTTVLNSSA